MADRLEVDMIVSAITQGFESIQADFDRGADAVKRAGDEAKSSGFKWTEMKSQIDLTVGAMQKVIELGQDLFQFGREGAMFAQTQQSFDGLIDKLGITTPLLEEMRTKTLDTVDDMTLMSSALTLVAGTSDNMARELLNATPQLGEIAKAASKLNPSLGDTAFLMESLGLGIKRASPMILDNLGLTIKLGAANEAMAAKLGKSVNELTAEEKQMALLNATIEAGARLIDQAGGNVASATDAYDQLTTTWKNLTDHIKAEATPSIAKVVTWLNDLVHVLQDTKLAMESNDIVGQSASWEEYAQKVLDTAVATGYLTEFEAKALAMTNALANENSAFAQKLDVLTESEFNALKAAEELTGAWDEGHRAAREQELAAEELTRAMQENEQATFNVDQAMKDLSLFMSGPLGNEYDKFNQKQEEVRTKMEEVRLKIEELNGMEHLTQEQQKELDDLQMEYDDLSGKYDENATAHDEASKRIMFNILQQRAAMDGLTQQEVEQLTRIAEEWGLVDSATAEYVRKADQYWAALAASGKASMDIVQSEILELLRLQSLVSTNNTIRYTIIVDGKIPTTPKKGDPYVADPPQGGGYTPPSGSNPTYVPPGGGYGYGQHGIKDFIVPPGFPRDSFRFNVSSGERVNIQSPGMTSGSAFGGGGGGNVIYNIYPQYGRYSNESSLTRDIKALEMLHNR